MPDNAQDPIRLKNLISDTASRLEAELGKREAAATLDHLNEAVEAVDHNRNYEGLAIFANEHGYHTLKTRFDLPENVLIDEKFSIRALLRAERRAEPYGLLMLSLDEARLFEGRREELFEVRTDLFPATNKSYGSGSKIPGGPGVNATALVDESRRRFIQQAVNALASLDDFPNRIIVAGTPEVLSEASKAFPVELDLIGNLPGNYLKSNVSEVGTLAWEAVLSARKVQSTALLEHLDKARGINRFESGIQSLVPLATEGRIETLVCGVNYQVAGRIDESGNLHLLDSPETINDMDDVVEWIVNRVRASGGTVHFIEDQLLAETPLAAVLRY